MSSRSLVSYIQHRYSGLELSFQRRVLMSFTIEKSRGIGIAVIVLFVLTACAGAPQTAATEPPTIAAIPTDIPLTLLPSNTPEPAATTAPTTQAPTSDAAATNTV